MGAQGWVTAYSVSSYIVEAGDVVTVNATVKNVGNDFGWFYAKCVEANPELDVTAVSPLPYYAGIEAGQSAQFVFSFTMPASNVVFRIAAMRWVTNNWVLDDKTGEIPITLQGGTGLPSAKVWQTSIVPDIAEVGTVVNIDVTLKNDGSVSGLLQPWVRDSNVGFEGYYPEPFWVEVAPGETALFKMRFTMPSYDVGFWLVACHWEADWIVDEWHNYYTVVAYAPTQEKARSLDCNYVRAA